MKLRFLLVLSIVFTGICSPGATLKLNRLTVGSTTYSNVTVLGANTTDLYFKHDHGIANVKLKYLSPELQKKFDYDPKAAEEAEKAQSENDQIYQSNLASNLASEATKVSHPAPKLPLTSEDSLADPISDRSLLGKSIPALELDKWLGEKPVLEGKFVLVVFWAPWSIPCRKYIPELNAIQKKLREKVVVVAVCSEPETEIAEANLKLDFPAGIDSRGRLSAFLGITSVPTVVLLDPGGIVRYEGHPAAMTEKTLQTLVQM